jgi:anaerobic selenocysteine-containing dehydrogenase
MSATLAARWGANAVLPGYRPPTSGFPLALISPASDERISSTSFGRGGAPSLLMHGDDARARGLAAGTRVRVWNELGAVVLPLEITDGIASGVVASEKGAWLATSATGRTISALVSADARADLAGGACFNDARVEVEAA